MTAPKQAPTTAAPALPSLLRRFVALLADWLLCLLAAGLVANPRQVPWPPVAVLVAEYGFFIGLFGQTPGMWLAKVRCVSARDGTPVGVLRATLRGLLLALVVPALVMDCQRRGLHDRAAGTVVVSAG
ncbi:MAG TPA: RDD family protein [Micromonosporaceae bacterium]|nr:RDD family protein [Micromonosporaceae bacterium]